MTELRAGDASFHEVNGTRLYAEIHGGGPTLLFQHGFTLDRRMWRTQVSALSDRFRVVAHDARGFGRSAVPGSDSYRHCDDTAALCDALGITRVIVIGHSLGAHQTLKLALSRPDLVAGWVSICMAGLAGIPFGEEHHAMATAIRHAAADGRLDEAKRLWAACGWFSAAREQPPLAEELDRMLADYSGWHWQNADPVGNIVPPASERLHELTAPALILSGDRDLPYNEAVDRALRAGIPSATAVRLPGVGHMANMEQPDIVNGVLGEFATHAFG